MLLIYLILSFTMVFYAGMFWTAYKVDKIEGRPTKMLWYTIGMALFGLYFMISMIGRASVI